MPPLPAESAPSENCRVLRTSLLDAQAAGWQLLQNCKFIAALATVWPNKPHLPQLPDEANAFYDFCLSAPGHTLLTAITGAIEQLTHAVGAAALPAPVLLLLRQLCAVAIERWVLQTAIAAAASPPELGQSLRLAIADPWAVYLIAAAQFCLRACLPGERQQHPYGLITVNAPAEGFTEDEFVKPLREAALAAGQGQAAIQPNSLRAQHLESRVERFTAKWHTTPMFGVLQSAPAHPLHLPERQVAIFRALGIHTVEYGYLPANAQQVDTELAQFEEFLLDLLNDLNRVLYPKLTKEDTMGNPATDASANTTATPVINFNFNNQGAVAFANASGAQAAARDVVNNHGVAPEQLATLLSAFLAEARQNPAMAAKLPEIGQALETLQQLPASVEPHAAQAAEQSAKTALAHLESAINSVESASNLLDKLSAIKDRLLLAAPWLVAIFKSGGS